CDLDMLLDNYSDLVSIGTIGDIVPLVSENRVFVKRGISNISDSDRVGISAIMKEAGLENKEITSGNISFTLVPRINAVGRLGMSQNSVSLLLTEDDEYAYEMASKLGADNLERQKIEREILENINSLIARNPSIVQKRVIVVAGEGWHQGVIGIVSSRIKDIYGKPCIVISNTGGVCRGSGRSIEGFDLWEAVSSCADFLNQYGGHPMAVGLSLDYDSINDFTYALNEFAKNKGEMPFQKLNIDCKLNPAYLDVDIAKDLKLMLPFGAGNPTPVFELCKLKITNIIPISNDKHLKILFSNGNTRISALKFFCSSADFMYKVGDVVDIAVNLEVNVYNNQENLSIIIKDIKFADIDNT
ncbi:MAG: DHH family phosphoesterase, partial [Ruminococcus sp.]